MSAPILTTKLYLPPPRPEVVLRPRLIERLNEGFGRKLTLISAPAGFGKTTLVSSWIYDLYPFGYAEGRGFTIYDLQTEAVSQEKIVNPKSKIVNRVAWLSLDEGDNDPTRFLAYLVAALQTIMPNLGAGALAALQAPQPPPIESLLTVLLNEIAALPDSFILVLDDYHVIEAQAVDQVLTFLLDHLPPQLHLVIATREDPRLPLARLRAQGQLTELRAADLRFTPTEAAEFLNRVMGLNLSAEEITALEARTEGWIAGLQLAALSMQGHQDITSFIKSFTGSHRFVLDYLVEEVLQCQPEDIQTFLLRTSILDRLCGPLCDAVLEGMKDREAGGRMKVEEEKKNVSSSSRFAIPHAERSSFILEYLERANLFIVPLDNERRWYRYHHLFGDLLRQRLGQRLTPGEIAELHLRASEWYESNGLAFEAFRHATAANDVERAERLIEGRGMPLHFRGVATAILDWLASLPKTVLDARPLLWVKSATLALVAGQTTGVEEKLQAAEKALPNTELDDKTRDLIGQIACARATLALTRYEPKAMIAQSHRALEYLHPDNLPFRFTANWALASACLLQGDRTAAVRACRESIAISQKSGDMFSTILATSDLGYIQELDNQLYQAAETYRRVLQLGGKYPQPNIAEVYLGLARISYEWNNLDAAEQHGQQSLQLARQYDRVIDRFIISEVFLARLKLAQGDAAGAAALLAQTDLAVRQYNFVQRIPELAAVQVLTLLHQGDVAAAAHLAQTHELPLSRARVHLAQGDTSAALAVLEPLRRQMEAKGWQDERLKVMVLQAIALHAFGEKDQAGQLLGDALALAEPGGFVRLFVDEGWPMRRLLQEAVSRGIAPDYARQLLAAFSPAKPEQAGPALPRSKIPNSQSALVEPLSERELEILQLIAEGLTNQEIANRLYLSLHTVKVHTRNIYGKLGAHHRASAVAQARTLGILPSN